MDRHRQQAVLGANGRIVVHERIPPDVAIAAAEHSGLSQAGGHGTRTMFRRWLKLVRDGPDLLGDTRPYARLPGMRCDRWSSATSMPHYRQTSCSRR